MAGINGQWYPSPGTFVIQPPTRNGVASAVARAWSRSAAPRSTGCPSMDRGRPSAKRAEVAAGAGSWVLAAVPAGTGPVCPEQAAIAKTALSSRLQWIDRTQTDLMAPGRHRDPLATLS